MRSGLIASRCPGMTLIELDAPLHPRPPRLRDPDAVPDRHDRLLPDPGRARRAVRPRAAARGQGDGEFAPHLPPRPAARRAILALSRGALARRLRAVLLLP